MTCAALSLKFSDMGDDTRSFAAEFLLALLRGSQMSQPHAVTTPMIRLVKLSGEVLCSFDEKLGRPSQGNLLNLERGGTLVKTLCELRLDMCHVQIQTTCPWDPTGHVQTVDVIVLFSKTWAVLYCAWDDLLQGMG
jgi:hypothetical protein